MTNRITAAWVPGLPHILTPGQSAGYKSLYNAAKEVGNEFKAAGVKRILFYSTQWISVLGQSVQARANPKGRHVDENWYDLPALPFDFNVDVKLAEQMSSDLISAGFQTRKVDYEGFPIDTGTIVAESLVNPSKLPVAMFSCCVYSDYEETKKLGQILRGSLEAQDGPSAVVVVSGLSGRYFTTEIDLREDQVRTPEDDKANRDLLRAFEKGDWSTVSAMRDVYCKNTKADMGLKALAFLEGMGVAVAGRALETRAYAPIYGTGAAVLKS